MSTLRCPRLWVLAATLLLCLCAAGAAQVSTAPANASAVPAPASAVLRPQRLVHQFDFEGTDDRGRKLGHGYRWPRHWYVIGRSPQIGDRHFQRQPLHRELIQRPGFPEFTEVRFDDRHVTSGEFSFYLGLNGGNAGSYLEVGSLPAVPGSDYLVTANVRTEALHHAAARLIAYFVDGQGRRIDQSVRATDPLVANGAWTRAAVKLPGEFDEAAWIGLEIELRQPAPRAGHPLGRQQIVLEDVEGGAWFDDISIWQVPHVEVATQSPVNILRAPRQPEVRATVRDLTGRRLVTDLAVYDHAMRRVDHAQYQVGVGAPTSWRWTPKLPGLGWYLIDMTVRDADDAQQAAASPVARTLGAVLWLPEARDLHALDAGRFSVLAEGLDDKQMALLPRVLEAALLDQAVVSVWDKATTLSNLEARLELLDGLLEETMTSGRRLGLSLHPLPTALVAAGGVGVSQPLDVLRREEALWHPYLAPVLMRHSQRVHRWYLGTPAQADVFYHDNLVAVMERLQRQFHLLAPRPRLVVPWRLHQQRRTDLPATLDYVVDVSPGVVAEHLPEHLEAWQSPPTDYQLVLREPAATRVAHPGRVVDLARRMIHAWRMDPGGLAVEKPWTAAAERRDAVLPDPLLGVFTNVAHQLAGRRVLGPLPVSEGLKGFVLDGPAGGMIVAWNEQAAPGEAVLDMFLGPAPAAVDVWGNPVNVALRDGRHMIALERTPTFITGIDPALAMFRASFKVEPAFIESRQVPHRRTVTLSNPWPRTISGHFQVLGPEGWQIAPSRQFFSIATGRTVTLPLTLQFPVAEVAGPKRLAARFDFTADQHYVVDMSAAMELGLPDVDFDATVALEPGDTPGSPGTPGEQDAVVACVITNKGTKNQALYVFANLAGHPRQERIIARLEPGQSVVRRFRFRAAADEVRDHPIRTGVRETNGPAILNKLLSPDPLQATSPPADKRP